MLITRGYSESLIEVPRMQDFSFFADLFRITQAGVTHAGNT